MCIDKPEKMEILAINGEAKSFTEGLAAVSHIEMRKGNSFEGNDVPPDGEWVLLTRPGGWLFLEVFDENSFRDRLAIASVRRVSCSAEGDIKATPYTLYREPILLRSK